MRIDLPKRVIVDDLECPSKLTSTTQSPPPPVYKMVLTDDQRVIRGLWAIITPPKKGGYIFTSVCLSVCLLEYSWAYERFWRNFSRVEKPIRLCWRSWLRSGCRVSGLNCFKGFLDRDTWHLNVCRIPFHLGFSVFLCARFYVSCCNFCTVLRLCNSVR